MSAVADGPTSSTRNHLVEELSEDLDVAIREFLERNPGTDPRRIRTAMRLVDRRTDGGRMRRVAPAILVIAAFVLGATLGWMLG